NAEVGDHTVVLRVNDGTVAVDQSFTITVANVNDAPIAVNDNLSAIEDNALTITSMTDLLVNDSDPDGDSLSIAAFTQPTHGALVDNGDGTLTYTPDNNFCNTDSFDYTISDGNGGTASGTAFIYVAPVGDTPQVTDAEVLAGSQSNPIVISRHAADGAEVTHFRISGINGGSLSLANGVTQVNNGDYISVAEGQAGLRFTPTDAAAEGSFQVESSEDGVTVATQSGRATSTIRITALPPTSTPEPEVTSEIEESIDEPVEEEITEEEVDEVVEETAEAVETPVETQLPVKDDTTSNSDSGQSGLRNSLINPISSFIQNVASANDNGSSQNTGQQSTLQALNVLLETTPIETLRNAWSSLDIGTLSVRDYDLVRGSFDALQQEVKQEYRIETAVVSSAIATTMGLSAGYVVWMLKGGSLLASLLSSMPAWHLADPLSILAGGSRDDEDDESLESIIKEGEKKEAKKEEDNQ
ncbi:MAG: tandem-95 repeat protein, partial [Desulfuromusa sp.]|nr:tandem-95 repeat protein [Desulfuromusa sp.]